MSYSNRNKIIKFNKFKNNNKNNNKLKLINHLKNLAVLKYNNNINK